MGWLFNPTSWSQYTFYKPHQEQYFKEDNTYLQPVPWQASPTVAAGVRLKNLLNPESRDIGLRSDITIYFLGNNKKNEVKKSYLK